MQDTNLAYWSLNIQIVVREESYNMTGCTRLFIMIQACDLMYWSFSAVRISAQGEGSSRSTSLQKTPNNLYTLDEGRLHQEVYKEELGGQLFRFWVFTAFRTKSVRRKMRLLLQVLLFSLAENTYSNWMQFASAIGIPGISTCVIETNCPYFAWFVIRGKRRNQITFTVHFGVGNRNRRDPSWCKQY